MTIRSIDVKRFSAISQRPFTDVLATIDAAIGHPDANALRHLATASTYAEVESVARSNVGPTEVPLSYDRIASLLDSYGNAQALSVARDVDSKIEALLVKKAGKS